MDQYLKTHGLETPTVPVYTGADTSLCPRSYDGESFRKRFDLPSKPLLLYMGTLAPVRRLEFLFDVLQQLDGRVDGHLVIMGGRDKANQVRLETEAQRYGVRDNVTFTGWVSSEETLNAGIVAADVGLSPIPTTGILRTNAPLKILEYLNLTTPVVATDTPDQRHILEGSGGGYVVTYDVVAFADAVEALLNSGSRREMGRQGRTYIKDNRSYEKLATLVLNAYEQHITS
jgi:glycosyltransferase involved in cell wall biosynthesis